MGRLPRNYAPIDTNLFSDPKIHPLSPGAKLLFIASLLYCNKEQTDGHLRRSDADHLSGLVKVRGTCRAELLGAGLWLETATGFEVVGFLDHNKSKAQRQKAADDAKTRYEDWLKTHANDVYNAVSNDVSGALRLRYREPENRDTESKAAAIGVRGDECSRCPSK